MRFLKTHQLLFIVTSKLEVIYSIASLTKKLKNKESHHVKLVLKKTKPLYEKISLVIIYEINEEVMMDVFSCEDDDILIIPAPKKLAEQILCHKN